MLPWINLSTVKLVMSKNRSVHTWKSMQSRRAFKAGNVHGHKFWTSWNFTLKFAAWCCDNDVFGSRKDRILTQNTCFCFHNHAWKNVSWQSYKHPVLLVETGSGHWFPAALPSGNSPLILPLNTSVSNVVTVTAVISVGADFTQYILRIWLVFFGHVSLWSC